LYDTSKSQVADRIPGRHAGAYKLRDASVEAPHLTIRIDNIASVPHQPADFGIFALRICRGDRVARRQMDQLDTPPDKKGAGTDKKRIGALAHHSCEGRIELAAGVSV